MVKAGAIRACDGDTDDMDEWVPFLRPILSAALSATVECAVCGGDGKWKQWESSSPCYGCEGTGRRLAIKEMLDE